MPPRKYGRVASKSSPPPPAEEPELQPESESEHEVEPESEVVSDLSDLTEPESDIEEVAQPAAEAPAKAKSARKAKTKEATAPTRRSTRVASTTVANAAAPAKQPTKRSKAVSQASLADIETKLKKTSLTTDKEKVQKAPRAQEKPYLNQLPQIPEHIRPAPLVFAWGAGNAGQFGMGDDPSALGELSRPHRNKLVEQMIREGKFGGKGAGLEIVAAGGMSTLFVDEAGTVWSCGNNDHAALGRETEKVPDPKKKGAFLDEDYLASTPFPIQHLVDEKFRAVRVAAGDSIAAAISAEGELRVWGTFRSMEGLLGFSSAQEKQYRPIPILNLKSKPGDTEKFVDVAAGNDHVVVLTTHGNIYTWGTGERGQLGRKVLERHKINGTAPERIVIGARANRAVAVGAGNYASFAVDVDGTVWGWGANSTGQTGTGYANPSTDREVHSPKKVVGLGAEELGGGERVIQIAGGDDHTLFLTSLGRVFACGLSIGGQLGLADDDEAFADRQFPDFLDRPVLVASPEGPEDDPVVQISAGTRTSMAITMNGALYMWGEGSQSELGSGEEEMLKVPTVVVRKDRSWCAVMGSCGGQHALALLRQRDSS